jgi:hypothetical protein
MDGFYAAYLTGRGGNTIVLLAIKSNSIVGVDAGGMKYDGRVETATHGGRAGPGCLNNNSASISGASAWVRPPRGAEEDGSRLDPGCSRQGSNADGGYCKNRDTDQLSFAPHLRFRRPADSRVARGNPTPTPSENRT